MGGRGAEDVLWAMSVVVIVRVVVGVVGVVVGGGGLRRMEEKQLEALEYCVLQFA